MKICCKNMLKALTRKDLKLHYMPGIALLGIEEERTIQTPKNKMPVDFCPFCGRRVEITFEEDDEQPAEVTEITAIYEIPKDE